MAIDICILDTGYNSYDYEKSLFIKKGYSLLMYDGLRDDHDDKIRFAENANGILVRWTKIGSEVIAKLPNLKVIVRYGTGYENINLEACRHAGVRVANVTGYGNHSVSNHALALMYASARDLLSGNKNFATIFGRPPQEKLPDFHEMTLGIIGLGRIGSTLASKARYLFKEIIATDPYVENDKFEKYGAVNADFDFLMGNSDVISIHCNLTEETRHMVNRESFLKTKSNLILINTARGPVIETEAFIAALDNDQIFRAGIDVFDSEIPGEIPENLINHPKVIATGHYAWYSYSSHIELQKRAADNMIGLLEGKDVEDCLTD